MEEAVLSVKIAASVVRGIKIEAVSLKPKTSLRKHVENILKKHLAKGDKSHGKKDR